MEDVVAALEYILEDERVRARAIGVGRSGRGAGRGPGAFNFDLRDDEEGGDGGVEVWEQMRKGDFGEGIQDFVNGG